MPPIKLSDAQLDAVFAAARPLPRASRDAFLLDLAEALAGIPDPGDGDVARAIRAVQRKHFDPPLTDGRVDFCPAISGWLSESGRILKAKHSAVLIIGKGFPIAGPGDDGAQGLFR